VDQATIDGCAAKADMADELLNLLAREWRAFLDTNPWPSWVDDRTEPGWHRIYFDFTAPPLPRFSVRVGEIAHDLRSALDHLAWREAVECVGLQQAERHASVITFPLANSPAAFKSANTLKYVGKDAWTVMERHQPYESPQYERPLSLGLLHWFNRLDKHRTIHVSAVGAPSLFTIDALKITFTHGACIEAVQPRLQLGQRLEGETEVARVRFVAGGPDPKAEVHRTPPLNPSFGEPPHPIRGIEITETIQQVRAVIADFANLIP
jgi:hypothetical protein